MTDRIPLDHLTSDQLDALYDQLEDDRKVIAHLEDQEKRLLSAEAALAEVAALRDDLRGITGARYIADILDSILDPTEQPAAQPEAATQAPEPHTGLVVEPYRNDRGENVWVFRCWGTDTCDGWLSLDHYSEQSAERARDRHVAEEHAEQPEPCATHEDGAECPCPPRCGCCKATANHTTEPATITDPAYLRALYAAAIRDTVLRVGDLRQFDTQLADAVMRVRDGYVAQLVQRLRIADQMQADYEERVVGDLNEKNIALAQRAGRAEAAIARVRSLAADMRESADTRWFADQLAGVLDGAPSAPATTRYIHVTITNRDEYTANRAALSLVDWIHAEFTGLQVTTDAHEWDAPAATEATEPATVTDPEYLRQQYAAIISALHDTRPDHIAAELLRVRDRHLQQLRQRLQLADELLATRDAELAAAKKTARGIGAWGVLQAIEQALPQGPTVAEAAADDARWWNGEKAGE